MELRELLLVTDAVTESVVGGRTGGNGGALTPVATGAGAERCALAAATLGAKVSTESESLINPTAPAAAWKLEGLGRDAFPEPGAGEAWSKATKPSSVIIQDTASSSKVLTQPSTGSH
jgi:hypothetical protein